MAKPLRPKRGTTAKNDAFTGLASEITIDTEKHSIRVHDGVTAGGHEILPKAKNDEIYAPKTLDVGVTSVNGNKGALTPAQTGCLPTSGGVIEGGVTVRADIHLEPPTSEGGQMVLMPALDDQTSSGVFIDTAWGQLRVFGHPSRDGVTRTGVGRVMCYDPYANAFFIDGQHIVRSVNGVNADASGNVPIEAGAKFTLRATFTEECNYKDSVTRTISGLTPGSLICYGIESAPDNQASSTILKLSWEGVVGTIDGGASAWVQGTSVTVKLSNPHTSKPVKSILTVYTS